MFSQEHDGIILLWLMIISYYSLIIIRFLCDIIFYYDRERDLASWRVRPWGSKIITSYVAQ